MHRRKWLARVKGDIKRMQVTVGEGVSDRATWRRMCRRTSTQHKSGKKWKDEDKFY